VKRVCIICQRISPDGNLWCQEPDCPAGDLPMIFDYGEWLGDIEVLRLLRILRTSAIYEAQREDEKVLLKVAHNGCQDQMRLEARILADLSQDSKYPPNLPTLLPAYRQADIRQRPYGKTVFRDEAKYYEVFEYVDGEFLRDMLFKNPQPWYQHAAWMTISLANALAFLHLKANKLHLNFSPEVIFVHTDKEGIPRPLLLDLGLLSDQGPIDPAWVRQYGMPAYTPPEIVAQNGSATYAADVYGLGLVLYEMLAGYPAFAFQQRREDDIRQDVLHGAPRLNRTDLSEEIHQIVNQAIEQNPDRRQQDVRAFAKLLRTKFGEVPPEKKRRWNRMILGIVAISILVIVIAVLLAALLG
jgi:serine/threonine protein kinase